MINIKNINISFDKDVIKDSCFQACSGKITGIKGISGSGKSSLLDVVSLLTYQGQFDYVLDDVNLKDVPLHQREMIQRTRIAYLRQKCVFLNSMNCLDHILLEAEIAGRKITEKEAKKLLEKVHLKKKAKVYPSKLSGGEEQRLAIAMALAKGADIIICDEITSMLDEENTKEIFSILANLAYEENKTVIIASHEDEVMDKADRLYSIEDYSLKLEKETSCNETVNKQNQLKQKENKKYIWQVAISRLIKRKLNFILMIIICAFTVSFLWYSKAIADENRNYWSNRLDSISQNDFLIYSNPTEYDLPDHYCYDYLPFHNDIQENLMQISSVKSVYPFSGLGVLDFTIANSSSEAEFSVYKDDSLVLSEKVTPYTGSVGNCAGPFNNLSDEIVFPWFAEQNLYDICEKKTSNREGVYICYEIAKAIGLETLEDGMTLKFDAYVPAAAYNYNMPVYTLDKTGQQNGSYIQPSSIPSYEKIEVSIPISGILPENYTDPSITTSEVFLYIPYEKIMSLMAEAKRMHVMKPIEYEYTPKAYRIFFSSEIDRKQLKEQILKIDDSAAIVDTYINKLASSEAREDNDNYLLGGTRFLLLISVVLMLVYGNYHKEDVIGDVLFFKIRGISTNEIKLQTVAEMTAMTVIISVLSILVSNLLMIYGLTYRYMLIFRETLSSSYPFMLAMNIGLAFLLSLISEIPLLMHQRK